VKKDIKVTQHDQDKISKYWEKRSRSRSIGYRRKKKNKNKTRFGPSVDEEKLLI